jgi:hypothetical protein
MTTDHPPFLAGQRVHLNSTTRPGDGHVLAVHPAPQLTGWEVIVRTFDTADSPGRTVNVFMTSRGCSLLTPAADPIPSWQSPPCQPFTVARTAHRAGAR